MVITIIILLILAGITISQLTKSSLFENSRLAKEKYENEQGLENNKLIDYEDRINQYINNENSRANINISDCTISISDKGKISISGITDMISFSVIKNNKCIDTTKSNEYTLMIPSGQSADIYVIVIDKDAKLYKSNTLRYTSQITYLYWYGYDEKDITGEFKAAIYTGDGRLDKKDTYMTYSCPYAASQFGSVATTNKIDFSQYNKLYIRHKTTSAPSNKILGLATKQTYDGTDMGFVKTKGIKVSQNEEEEYLDISDINGEYYIQLYFNGDLGAVNSNIYAIWLEK